MIGSGLVALRDLQELISLQGLAIQLGIGIGTDDLVGPIFVAQFIEIAFEGGPIDGIEIGSLAGYDLTLCLVIGVEASAILKIHLIVLITLGRGPVEGVPSRHWTVLGPEIALNLPFSPVTRGLTDALLAIAICLVSVL